jgi:hypothetical protein
MRSVNKCVLVIALGLMPVGCTVDIEEVPPPQQREVIVEQAPPPEEVVVAPAPLVDDPAVIAVEIEPPPEERVYVYDPGFPPGVYISGGFYFYEGHRYPHDIFIDRVVTVNVRDHRFADPDKNRRAGVRIEAQHRAEYTRKQQNAARRAAQKKQQDQDQRKDQPQQGSPGKTLGN